MNMLNLFQKAFIQYSEKFDSVFDAEQSVLVADNGLEPHDFVAWI